MSEARTHFVDGGVNEVWAGESELCLWDLENCFGECEAAFSALFPRGEKLDPVYYRDGGSVLEGKCRCR
jgi:hypothetical protein